MSSTQCPLQQALDLTGKACTERYDKAIFVYGMAVAERPGTDGFDVVCGERHQEKLRPDEMLFPYRVSTRITGVVHHLQAGTLMGRAIVNKVNESPDDLVTPDLHPGAACLLDRQHAVLNVIIEDHGDHYKIRYAIDTNVRYPDDVEGEFSAFERFFWSLFTVVQYVTNGIDGTRDSIALDVMLQVPTMKENATCQ